ncbi:MAG: hypothetical protein NTX86_03215 [Candidatus Dependentiae bacterium]|nr:hypothetical protein [Candidatus Dependentiae bacterium]
MNKKITFFLALIISVTQCFCMDKPFVDNRPSTKVETFGETTEEKNATPVSPMHKRYSNKSFSNLPNLANQSSHSTFENNNSSHSFPPSCTHKSKSAFIDFKRGLGFIRNAETGDETVASIPLTAQDRLDRIYYNHENDSDSFDKHITDTLKKIAQATNSTHKQEIADYLRKHYLNSPRVSKEDKEKLEKLGQDIFKNPASETQQQDSHTTN